MNSPDRPSRTALITCLMRALHTRSDRPALIQDDWADRLVLPEERKELASAVLLRMPSDQREAILANGDSDAVLHGAWRNRPVYAGVVIRTRYTEERIERAVSRGVRQYVILGAGLDSFGLRQPAFARDLQVFEVDSPASQEFKRQRMRACGVATPSTLHFVAGDLAREELGSALARAAFRFDEPAIFSWLGVTVYLPREANLATLRSIGRFAAAGSELVFTYIEQRALESASPHMQRVRAYAAAIGEPWLSGFDSATLGGELLALGLQLEEHLGGRELHDRYCAGRTDGLSPGRAGRIARARVTGRAR